MEQLSGLRDRALPGDQTYASLVVEPYETEEDL